MRNQAPVHEPAVVGTSPMNNDGNVRGSLLGGNVETRRVTGQIAVKIPANPEVSKLERRCDAATHRIQLIHCLGLAQRAEEWRFDGRAGYSLNKDAGTGTIDMLE
jgi:hypothetical protein